MIITKNKTEKRTLFLMIKIYCNHHHHTKGICDDCSDLYDYAVFRADKCPFGTRKPVCSACTIHCYNLEMREQIRKVMRFSGPKMIFRHPVFALIHLYRKITDKKYKNPKVLQYGK